MKTTLRAENNHRPKIGDLSIVAVFAFAFSLLMTTGTIVAITVVIIGIGWPLPIGRILLRAIKQSTVKLASNLRRLFRTPSNGVSTQLRNPLEGS